MAQHGENRTIGDAVELLKTNGFDGLAEAVTVLLNSAMVAERSEYLRAAPYERSAERTGYANGYKDKAMKTRLGTLPVKVPQTRDSEFYPQSLERGLRSERALLLAIAEMYVQGVSTRRVKRIVEELCGTDISSTQVSRAAAELDGLLEAWRCRDLDRYPYLVSVPRVMSAICRFKVSPQGSFGTICLSRADGDSDAHSGGLLDDTRAGK